MTGSIRAASCTSRSVHVAAGVGVHTPHVGTSAEERAEGGGEGTGRANDGAIGSHRVCQLKECILEAPARECLRSLCITLPILSDRLVSLCLVIPATTSNQRPTTCGSSEGQQQRGGTFGPCGCAVHTRGMDRAPEVFAVVSRPCVRPCVRPRVLMVVLVGPRSGRRFKLIQGSLAGATTLGASTPSGAAHFAIITR